VVHTHSNENQSHKIEHLVDTYKSAIDKAKSAYEDINMKKKQESIEQQI
jgi:flagellin-specific chaperone FliS